MPGRARALVVVPPPGADGPHAARVGIARVALTVALVVEALVVVAAVPVDLGGNRNRGFIGRRRGAFSPGHIWQEMVEINSAEEEKKFFKEGLGKKIALYLAFLEYLQFIDARH